MDAVKIDPFSTRSQNKKILNLSEELPGDKSLTHRALIIAAMASGETLFTGYSESADCQSTCEVLRPLGVRIFPTEVLKGRQKIKALLVQGLGVSKWTIPDKELDFGNSGTTARLMIGVLASCPGLVVSCRGDGSLSQRPMNRIVDPLRRCGARIEYLGADGKLPLRIFGQKLKAIHHEIPQASAQIKSALCLAALQTSGCMSMELPGGARDHTEKILKKLGAQLTITNVLSSDQRSIEKISIEGPFVVPSLGQIHIPHDPSAMIFLWSLGVLHPDMGALRFEKVLSNTGRLAFVALFKSIGLSIKESLFTESNDALEAMSRFEINAPKDIAEVRAGFHISREKVSQLIDEIPMLALLSAFLNGESKFFGLEELRVKECDRLQQTCQLLELIGARFKLDQHDLTVMGSPHLKFQGFEYNPQSDHRMAMVASIVATKADSPSLIIEPRCVDVSFPNFFSSLNRCGIRTEMYNHPHFQIDDISFRDIGKICDGEKSSNHYCG